jgi:hypothetical protein
MKGRGVALLFLNAATKVTTLGCCAPAQMPGLVSCRYPFGRRASVGAVASSAANKERTKTPVRFRVFSAGLKNNLRSVFLRMKLVFLVR